MGRATNTLIWLAALNVAMSHAQPARFLDVAVELKIDSLLRLMTVEEKCGQWKFNGFVVSDFAAVEQLMNHGIASTREHAGILGYGLSYTTFSYSNIRIANARVKPNEDVKLSVDVANTGARSGDEAVQLYIRDEVASVTRPVKELKGFQRVSLNAGEKTSVEFVVKHDELAFYNLEMKRVVEPGWFKVMVGGNSVDVIETRFELQEK